MPAFNPKAVERIRNVVKYVEGNVPGLTKQAPRQVESLPWNWWVLTEDLDSDTHEAAANPLEWYVSRNDGDGEYSQDISTFKVRDTLENSGAVAGDIVLCRPIGSENGTVLEIVLPRSEPRLAWATTSGDVLSTASEFTVTPIVPMDGTTWNGDDPLTVKNSPDAFSLDSGTTGKIIYCKDPTGDGWSWHPFDFSCCSDCECECNE